MACLKKWLTGTNFFVYCSHFLSAWGDRMWSFGVGLFLIEIAPESLQLTAIYGLSSGVAILLLGAIIGDWVDRTPRLKAAQLALVLQNAFVVLCAACIYAYLRFMPQAEQDLADWLSPLGRGVIILLAILGNLASLARVIAVERDWIVEICAGDKDLLAKMTSTLRRIDLATNILAPIVSGQIMSFAGIENGAAFMGGWNLLSVFVEYYLIWKVYNTVPALTKKKDKRRAKKSAAGAAAAAAAPAEVAEAEGAERGALKGAEDTQMEPGPDAALELTSVSLTAAEEPPPSSKEVGESRRMGDEIEADVSGQEGADTVTGAAGTVETQTKKPTHCCMRMLSVFLTLGRGWRTYMHYDVANAGLGLACLYMTVLGFDNITVGFAYMQGVSELVVGVLMAAGAIVGIIGTLVYPVFRRRFGLERTGLMALFAQIACLTLCVGSVFTPGSPFDLFYASRPQVNTTDNCTTISGFHSLNTSASPLSSYGLLSSSSTPPGVDLLQLQLMQEDNSTVNPAQLLTNGTGASNCVKDSQEPVSIVSISLLLAGIVSARFGLWLADLTITQLFLERVVEEERGIVNGVQSSLNKLMDMLKFIMVVIAPQPQVFGLLVIISFGFICLGFAFYSSYSRRARGHLLPLHNLRQKNHRHPAAA